MVEFVIVNVTFYFILTKIQFNSLHPPLNESQPTMPFSARSFYVHYVWCMVIFRLDLLPSPHVLMKFITFSNYIVFDIFSIFTNTQFVFSLIIVMGTLNATVIDCEVAVEGCFCYIGIAA